MALQENFPHVFHLLPLRGIDLDEVSISQIQKYYESGTFTSVDYVHFCLERIRTIDLYLEAVIEVNPDALDIAAELDEERIRGRVRGSLHGIPIMIKDIFDTKDQMQTTAGSWALLGSNVPRDAFVVSRLRRAGAIIIGKTNLSEWSSLRSKRFSTGYSPRRGQVRNPFDLSRSPFGSSGGSAVVVSANIVPLAVGTETDTSICGPALINGLVGLKPTPGLTSRSGVIPSSETFDTVGPLCRTVLDAALGLNAMVGLDSRDPGTMVDSRREEVDYTAFMRTRAALKGAKFGLPYKRCWELVPEDQKKVAIKLFDAMRQAGAKISTVDYPCAEDRIAADGDWDWELGKPSQREFTVVKVEAYNCMNAYLSELSNTSIKTIEDIVKYNIENRGTEGAYPGDHAAFPTGQDNFDEILEAGGRRDDVYHEALKYVRQKTREEGIDAALQDTDKDGKHVELDALILCDRKGIGQQISAQASYPTITLPIGVDDIGMPIGLLFQQTAWQEGKLILWASAVEDLRNEVLGGRPVPRYRNYLAKNIPILPC